MDNHTDFILSSISDILKEVVSANTAIGNGIETYPLSEYILQTAFLKMTGFQEQKMKCICWELATQDYEYRYKRYTQSPLGECSTYKDKNTIYNDLIDVIKKHKPNFDISTEINKLEIKTSTLLEIKSTLSLSNLSSWSQSSFADFMGDANLIPTTQFITGNDRVNNLFESLLIQKYTLLYSHRNRCAHNTQSYQENLPTLKSLLNPSYQYDNYFVRFTILILIDKIFIDLYKKYQAVLEIY